MFLPGSSYLDLVYLSEQFYDEHPNPPFGEILEKKARPYLALLLKINGTIFAIPFRHTIKHQYCLRTNPKKPLSGLDYSKAIVISDTGYIDRKVTPKLEQEEFDFLKGKETKIIKGFTAYLREYKNALHRVRQPNCSPVERQRHEILLSRSALQYFNIKTDRP